MSSLLQLDMAARAWVVQHRLDPLNGPLYLLTVAGRFGAIWIVCALALAVARRVTWRRAGRVVIAMAIPLTLCDYLVKPIVARPRPFVAAPVPSVIGRLPTDASFPSGHATSSFAGATALTMVEPALSALWWALAAAIAYSRIYLGVHYPSDVLAGAGIGAFGAWLIMTRFARG